MKKNKLHLGCGQVYMDGYLNIDFPPDHHSVQIKSVADKYCDITTLKYKNESIKEVRLHHVFEHFDRAIACALIGIWRNWLEVDGIIRIEVPDFQKTSLQVLSPFSSHRRKKVGLRHIFGSQEAHWAIHYDGWTKKSIVELMNLFGFKIKKISKNSWRGTHNIQVIAHKNSKKITKNQSKKLCKKWLEQYMVDDTPGEKRMLSHWLSIANNHIDLYWVK